MALNNHLKEYRARINVNQQELGAMVHVSRQTISLIERGDYSPSVSLALKLARVLDAKVEDLFEYREDGGEEIKIIFSDLDGTLLNSSRAVSDETKDTVIKCQEKGLIFVACTARPERAISEYIEAIPFDAVVSLNGARVRVKDKNIDNGMSYETSHRIISELSRDKNKIIVLETGKGIFSDTLVPEWDISEISDLTKLDKDIKVFKILVIGKDNKFETVERNEGLILFKDIKKEVENLVGDDTYFSVSENWIYQIMAKNDTKWNGVTEILNEYGFTKEEAIYFGDDNDDAESIKNIGCGIAMGNAIERVKEAADVIIRTNDENGVAEYLREKFL